VRANAAATAADGSIHGKLPTAVTVPAHIGAGAASVSDLGVEPARPSPVAPNPRMRAWFFFWPTLGKSVGVPSQAVLTAARVTWFGQFATLWWLLDDAGASDATLAVVAIGICGGIVASLVPSTVSLTVWRTLAPLPLVAAIGAWMAGASPLPGLAAVVAALVAMAAVMTAEVGEHFVQGSAYGDERRFPLKPPVALVAGPLPLAWAVAALPVPIGLVLAAESSPWWLGLAAVGAPLALVAGRALHRLSRRFLVFVPAGFVVHDHVVLAESLMVPTSQLSAIGLALADTSALDLTGVSLGRAIEMRFRSPQPVARAAVGRGTRPEGVVSDAVLLGPTRPGAMIAEARRRSLPVG
jgi:hypothetical protein